MSYENIFDLFTLHGESDYIGEPVTQIEHMVQAAMLAEKDGQSKEVILAALFHDIGHLIQLDYKTNDKSNKFDKAINNLETMGNYGIKNHEKIGAEFLRLNGINYPIPELVENHVKVKKYRTYKDKEYYNKLSPASLKTLEYQGGPMTKIEAEEFEEDPLFSLSLKIRDYDDAAKVENMEIKSLDYYKEMCYTI